MPALIQFNAGTTLSLIPRPRAMGMIIILIAILAFTTGFIQNELILSLLGAIFLAVHAYCFISIFFLGILHRKKFLTIYTDIVTKKIFAGGQGELFFSQKEYFFSFPGTIVRYNLKLKTQDGRRIDQIFNPANLGNDSFSFPVPERGAYYGASDELLIFDTMGFFRLSFLIQQGQNPRLLAAPAAADEKLNFKISSGGREKQKTPNFRRTDDLTENRPYVPGDDPRRINWKLFGHVPGGELFVREGERAAPPHSRFLMFLDTQADPDLYSPEESCHEIDILCENALTAIREFNLSGKEILIGYTGGKIQKSDAFTLAWPAALPLWSEYDFPQLNETLTNTPSDWGLVILALPRSSTGNTALDRFLSTRLPQQSVDLIFLHSRHGKKANDKDEAGRACAAFYGRKNAVHARSIIVF